MKKQYRTIALIPLRMEFEGSLLDGSYTNQAMKVNQVTVEDYENGFDSEPGGFKDITFD